MNSTPNWDPFWVQNTIDQQSSPMPSVASTPLIAPRPLSTPSYLGLGDRLRAAAFAELQAEHAFLWAADRFEEAPTELRSAWKMLAAEERKHRIWLLERMTDLNLSIRERPVSDALWRSLIGCQSAKEFCHYIADAEERGRRAGERFFHSLQSIDMKSAQVFGRIADEERGHIELAYRFYPV